GVSRQRTAHQEPPRPEDGCPREPVAAETPHLRAAPQLVLSLCRDSRGADVLAPTRRPRAGRQHLHPADAEGADPNEHPVGECHQRSERVDWAAHCPRDARRRTGSSGARGPESPGIHATRETIAKSLEGTWQPDLLFVLQQEVAMYDAYQQRIAECDHALEQHLKGFADKGTGAPPAGEPAARPERGCARVPSGGGNRAAMPRSLTWAVNCTASAASTSRGSTASMSAWLRPSSAKSA